MGGQEEAAGAAGEAAQSLRKARRDQSSPGRAVAEATQVVCQQQLGGRVGDKTDLNARGLVLSSGWTRGCNHKLSAI